MFMKNKVLSAIMVVAMLFSAVSCANNAKYNPPSGILPITTVANTDISTESSNTSKVPISTSSTNATATTNNIVTSSATSPTKTSSKPNTPLPTEQQLKYKINADNITCTITDAILSTDKKLYIPSMIDGYVVTSIGDAAFDYCENLTSISIPDSVTSIGNSAFFYCKNLTSIELPNTLTNIDAYAFGGCESLKNIIIPDKITIIKENTFGYCKNL